MQGLDIGSEVPRQHASADAGFDRERAALLGQIALARLPGMIQRLDLFKI
jgi:hypothetical protein